MLLQGLLAALLIGCVVSQKPPTWPAAYNISGTLRLPYAEIKEPFSAWFDTAKNRTRVDYYGSSVITIQLPNANTSYKIAPVFLKEKSLQKCFQVNSTKEAPISPQSVLPDLKDFQKIADNTIPGAVAWQKVVKIGLKKNTYTMWVSAKNAPIRYEMMGYDTLLGSHYDKYYLDYDPIYAFKNISDDIFKPWKGMQCGDFPGPGNAEHSLTMNPMQEYIGDGSRHVDNMFDHFRKDHGRRYQNHKEHQWRNHQFRQNVRFIHSKNRAGLTYSLKLNHLADKSDAEMSHMRGYRHTVKADNGAIPFNKLHMNGKAIPDYLDWRLYGAVTPVKDQAACGSCWSFGTVGAVEGAYFIKTGELVRLSQQELMDCSWDQGNNGCDGGEDFRAYQWILKNGLATEEDYGPYLSQDGYCHYKNITSRASIKGYVNVTSNDEQDLRLALATFGPISVAIDASHKSLSFYANGVYFEPQCGSTSDDLDHAVLAVGYGVLNGQAYWLIKNSWSTYWGNNGYVLMSQSNNNCGVATAPTFVLM